MSTPAVRHARELEDRLLFFSEAEYENHLARIQLAWEYATRARDDERLERESLVRISLLP